MLRRLGLLAVGLILVVLGGALAHLVQTVGGVSVKDVRWTAADGQAVSALLYTPNGATTDHPAPAILISHGYINTREMQSPFAIEFARRGFVVLSMDMAGHGYSGGAVGDHDGGGPEALTYLRALPFVDRANIGLEGHSMGGVPMVGAALSQPDGYRAMVLEGSTTPDLGQVGTGTPRFPRNLQLVFGQYDEFAGLMWKEPKGASVGQSAKMKALFGVSEPIVPDRLYGSLAAGDGRRLVNPPVTHPMEHFSSAGIGAAVDWFQQTLTGEANPLPPGDQIWFWKEIGTLAGLVGYVFVVIGAFDALLGTPLFTDLAMEPVPPTPRSRLGWWLGFALVAGIPAATFYPLMGAGFLFFPSRLFPQWVTNQLVVWTVANAVISGVLLLVPGARRVAFRGGGFRLTALAILAAAAGYATLAASDALFKTDFRFWVVGLKPLDARHALQALAYLPVFTLSFVISTRALQNTLAVAGQSLTRACLISALASSLGFIVLLGIQYGGLFGAGLLVSPKEALNTIIAIQFVPVLATVGVISAFTYKRTGSALAGGVLCGILVTGYIVAGTATHWRPGWTLPKSAGLYPARPVAAATPAA